MGFEILTPHLFSRSDLQVTYRPGQGEYRSSEAHRQIDRTWERHLANYAQNGLPAFNGSLFRLTDYALNRGRLLIELGDTTFREYVGTSTEDFYGTYPEAWVANPLAVCIALITGDEKILIERRTTLTRYRAPYHVIGGFMERGKDFSQGKPDPFAAITREIKEELGLILSPDEPVALGLVRNLRVRHPEIVFFCSLSQSFAEVQEIMGRDAADDEIDHLEYVEDRSDHLSSFLKGRHGIFTPSGEACLLLYGRQRYGEGWYDALLEDL